MNIAVLLSGGVDSSVAMRLLKKEGYNLTAFYLKIWLQDDFSFLGNCPWEEDLNFAHAVCKQANVTLEVIPLQTEYWDKVVSYTISEIKDGRTPNPDMFCNRLIKFGEFYDKINDSFEKVASGHYARLEFINNKYQMLLTPDPIKDQTYFLAYLTQEQLKRALFPLGNLNKHDVRKLAHKFELSNMNRKDSQGICFLGRIKFNEFIKQHLGEIKGDIINISTGKKVGTHNGYYFYTIGQRSGLGLSGGPWYVVKKDIKENIIYISHQNLADHARDTFNVSKFNWIAEETPSKKNLRVKIRHGANMYNCSINFINETLAEVKLDKPDQGIAPGQFAVFYDDNVCLGGGVIVS